MHTTNTRGTCALCNFPEKQARVAGVWENYPGASFMVVFKQSTGMGSPCLYMYPLLGAGMLCADGPTVCLGLAVSSSGILSCTDHGTDCLLLLALSMWCGSYSCSRACGRSRDVWGEAGGTSPEKTPMLEVEETSCWAPVRELLV